MFKSCCPREGRGLHPKSKGERERDMGCCPREGRGLHLLTLMLLWALSVSCCPREGRGLHLKLKYYYDGPVTRLLSP